MKRAIIIFMTVFSSSVFAFNSVSEILPSGKILICQKSGQIKNGDTVEVHKRTDPRSSSDYSTAKHLEFKLPTNGQRIKLVHKDFHSIGKKSNYHTEELGTAIITNESLEGEERVSYALDNSRYSRRIEKRTKVSKEEAESLQKKCLVAIPENGLKLSEKAAVSWE